MHRRLAAGLAASTLALITVVGTATAADAAPADKPQVLSNWTQTSASSYNTWNAARANQAAWSAYAFDWSTDYCSSSPDNPFGFPSPPHAPATTSATATTRPRAPSAPTSRASTAPSTRTSSASASTTAARRRRPATVRRGPTTRRSRCSAETVRRGERGRRPRGVPHPAKRPAQPATGSPGLSWKAVRGTGRMTPDRSWAATLLRSATERPSAWCGHSPAATRRLRSPHSRAGALLDL